MWPASVALLLSLVAAAGVQAQTVPPRPLSGAVPPEYPEAALNAGLEGPVTYRANVGADGTVTSVEILKVPATGHGFEDAVRRAVTTWTFAPATSAGTPVDGVYDGVAQFSPALPGEFVFDVTPAAAWIAVERMIRELDGEAVTLDRRRQVLVTRWARYRDRQYVPADRLGLPRAVRVDLLQWHVAVPPGFATARVAVAAALELRRSDGFDFTKYNDPVLGQWFIERLAERLGRAGTPLSANPVRRAEQSPPTPASRREGSCPSPSVAGRPLTTEAGRLVSPRVISQVMPRYPLRQLQDRTQVSVTVTGTMTEHGTFSRLAVQDAQVPEELRTASLLAASLWRFRPETLDGCPTMTAVTVQMAFRLFQDTP